MSEVLAHYCEYHPRCRPGKAERRLVAARFREGYTVDDLKRAIDGCHKSPFHCGENDSGQTYQTLGLIMRNADKVSQFIRLAGCISDKESVMGRASANGGWMHIRDDKEKYAAYLCSRDWAEKREAVRQRCGGTCERCRVLPMNACHHLTYARKYDEPLEDLQAICAPCHEFTHGKSDLDPLDIPQDTLLYLAACKRAGKMPVGEEVLLAYPTQSTYWHVAAIEAVIKGCQGTRAVLFELAESGDSDGHVQETAHMCEYSVDEAAAVIERELIGCDVILWIKKGKPWMGPPPTYERIRRWFGFE